MSTHDLSVDLVLEPPPRSRTDIGRMEPVTVSLDMAEGQGRIWLSDPQDNMIAIEGPANAELLAHRLLAWVEAERALKSTNAGTPQ